jgi:hypothetical protein
MAQHVYSASTNAFYPTALQATYEAAGTWPDDVIEVTDEEEATYMGAPPPGQTRGAGPDGHPTWVDLPPPSLADQASAMLQGTVTVQCAAVPALDAEYAVDPTTRVAMNGVTSAVNAGHGLPSGGASFNWPDAANAAHDWPEPQFMAFADAVSKFVYQATQVAGGHDTTLPSTTLTI